MANSHNAYRNCPQPLTPAGSGNLTLTALSYAADAWGRRWYAIATPGLVDAGSRTAAAAGLWHYTTQVNQAKEADTPVDIGFHYVAFCGGTPCDTDHDGLGDFLEDRNGNGLRDAGESDWQNPDTDGYRRPLHYYLSDMVNCPTTMGELLATGDGNCNA